MEIGGGGCCRLVGGGGVRHGAVESAVEKGVRRRRQPGGQDGLFTNFFSPLSTENDNLIAGVFNK